MSRILLVDDTEANRDMLGRRLTRRGYMVTTAEDGEQAVAQGREELPDLILMDLSLPVMDGCEATKLLKADPATAKIPVIALTASDSADDRVRAAAAGCDDFDTKPIDLDRLLSKITALLARKGGS